MGDYDFLAGDLSRLRQGAHEFLRRYAARAWDHEHDGVRWDITLPPDVAGLPRMSGSGCTPGKRPAGSRGAQLYDVDAEVTGRAAGLGAAIRRGRHEEAATLADYPRVAATSGIDAPAASGFLRWQDPGGIGCIPEPGPVVADAGPSSAEAGTPGLALLYTTLAAWRLLSCPNAVYISQQPVPAAQHAADRAAGLRTGPVTVATAARIP